MEASLQDQNEHAPEAALSTLAMLGSICRNNGPIDLDSCCLLLEIHEHGIQGGEPSLVGAYFIVDGITKEDAWDATCFFHHSPELLIDVYAIDEICTPRLLNPSIRYTDEPRAYLSSVHQLDLLRELPEGGLLHEAAWIAYSSDRISSRPTGHASTRGRIASLLGLPFLEHYDRSSQKPLPIETSDVDESYLVLVVSDTASAAASAPTVEAASSQSDVPVVDSTPSAIAADVVPGIVSEAASDVVLERLVETVEAVVEPGDPVLPATFEPERVPAADSGSDATPSDPAPPVRKMTVARAPATGRRSFPFVSDVLEKGVPLHGTDGEDVSSVTSALADLRRSVPWMSNVVDLVEEEVLFGWASGSPMKRVHPILMSGPSGAGKTRFARMLAKALDLRFSSISLAGSTDNRHMEGTTAGWINARASWPSLMIADRKSANPMLLVDEIEKVDSTYNGDPRRTLVTMLDPETNFEYHDVGLDCAVDLSCVSWILCCNEHRQLDVALRDRLRVLEVVGPSAEHLPLIVDQAMRDVGERMGVDASRLPDMGDLMLSKANALFRTSKSMRAVVRCVDDMVRHRVVADARRGIRLPPAPVAEVVDPQDAVQSVEGDPVAATH
jgi:hypothetical protein